MSSPDAPSSPLAPPPVAPLDGVWQPRIRPRRDALAAAGAVLAVSALGVFVTYYFARQAQIDALRNELGQVARIAALRVDGDAHRRLDSPDKDMGPEYRAVVAPLVALQRASDDVVYVYTAILRDHRVLFGVDSAAVYHAPGDTEPYARLFEEYLGGDADLRRALVTQAATVNVRPQLEPERAYLSAYAPFNDSAGRFVGVVGVDLWVRALDRRMARLATIALAAFAGLVALSGLVGLVVFQLRSGAAAATARDRQALGELAEARRAAETSSRAKLSFLAMMSHELRTPLNAIVGYGELMHDELTARGQAHLAQDIARVNTAGRHLSAVISHILDFSKIEAGCLTPLRSDVWPEARDALVDPVRFRQVLLHLVGNALKFTHRGGVTVRLRPGPLDPSCLVCTVHDTGVGIPADKRGSLFEPFSQVDNSLTRVAGGTGLGLVISRRVVEAMGGTLHVKSRMGTGSSFRISLPGAVPPSDRVA